MKFYKVLSETGESQNGGQLKWSLPTGEQPGEWHEAERVEMCYAGLHLTTKPAQWWKYKCRVFEVEAEGLATSSDGSVQVEEGNKVVAKRVRLMRELTETELFGVRIYRSGVHSVEGRDAIVAEGTSQVKAYGTSQVKAYGTSQVTACDSSQVTAYGTSQVKAYGTSQVKASGSADVTLPEKDRWGYANKATCKLRENAVCLDRTTGKPRLRVVKRKKIEAGT